MELKTLQYFSHNLTDPIHEVFQVWITLIIQNIISYSMI